MILSGRERDFKDVKYKERMSGKKVEELHASLERTASAHQTEV